MKCTVCHALLCEGDEICIACGATLTTVKRQEAARTQKGTPASAYVFAAFCAGIPLAALGGLYASILGLVGAFLCLFIARLQNIRAYARFSVCLGITLVAWLIFLTIIVDKMPEVRKRFYGMF